MPDPSDARPVLEATLRRPPTLGAGRLLVIDGPSGSGKTTLAEQVQALAPSSALVHTDDLLDGWDGLPGLAATLDRLLTPLASGREGRYRRYDWLAGGFTETRTVSPLTDGGLLVVEGVGAGSLLQAVVPTLLVWLEVDEDTRVARSLARDGAAMQQRLADWREDEQRLFAVERTRERADLRLGTLGEQGA